MLIPLTQRKYAIVDSCDYEWLSEYKWYANLVHGIWYAQRNSSRPNRKLIRMKHSIMGVSLDSLELDHVNGNGLDNRRCNLRWATRSQNKSNRRVADNNTSGFKGVNFYKGKWRAYISINYERKYLGYFQTKEEAIFARKIAALNTHKEFAFENR